MKKYLMLLLCCTLLLSGCGGKGEPKPEEPAAEVPAQEEKDPYEGLALNPLTGEYIPEAVARRRPIAVMINNLHKALPQSGIAEADVMYECLAEGEITRLVAVFQDFTGDKIGPVRSARDYYAVLALDNDAIYIHHGGSEGGYDTVARYNIDDLDGMHDTTAFWRDKNRQNQPGMYEHSSYISAEGVMESWQQKGYRMNTAEDYYGAFHFAPEANDLTEGTPATSVVIPYSSYQTGQFTYDEATKTYLRYQSGAPHIDDQTGETLSYKNVLIQFTDMRVIDNAGRRDVDLVGKGEGIYITEGKCIPVGWEKLGTTAPTEWFVPEGEGRKVLEMNPGKTWVCIYQNGADYTVE